MIFDSEKEREFLDYANDLVKEIRGPGLDIKEIKEALEDFKRGKREDLEYEITCLNEELDELRRANEELYANIIYFDRYGY